MQKKINKLVGNFRDDPAGARSKKIDIHQDDIDSFKNSSDFNRKS